MSQTLELADGVYDADIQWRGMVLEDVAALTAATFPVKPPTDWFADPQLTKLTPLTVDNTGRVFGHIAAWHTSHIGMAGGVKPPRSKSNYAFFRTGVVETDAGDFVDVGQITLAGGHASLDASVAQAVAHYDDTRSAVMDVAAGEDKYGIWVAGGLRPDVSDEQLRTIRASSVSGDWRPINGRLELVAVCAVNAPGFPIPRARVAAGAPIALVAAGTEPLVEAAVRRHAEEDVEAGIQAGLEIFHNRITHIEALMLQDQGSGPAATEQAEDLRTRVHDEKAVLASALRARVQQAKLDALRSRVKGDDPVPLADRGDAPEGVAAAGMITKLRQRRSAWTETLHPRDGEGQFSHSPSAKAQVKATPKDRGGKPSTDLGDEIDSFAKDRFSSLSFAERQNKLDALKAKARKLGDVTLIRKLNALQMELDGDRSNQRLADA